MSNSRASVLQSFLLAAAFGSLIIGAPLPALSAEPPSAFDGEWSGRIFQYKGDCGLEASWIRFEVAGKELRGVAKDPTGTEVIFNGKIRDKGSVYLIMPWDRSQIYATTQTFQLIFSGSFAADEFTGTFHSEGVAWPCFARVYLRQGHGFETAELWQLVSPK